MVLLNPYPGEGISGILSFPKLNVIAWQEFELSYYDLTVHYDSHCATKTSFCVVVSLESFLHGSKRNDFLNRSIRPMGGFLAGHDTLGQSGPGINGNERALYNSQMLRIEASLLDSDDYYT